MRPAAARKVRKYGIAALERVDTSILSLPNAGDFPRNINSDGSL
jgi:hypothetical protein